jgi:hypothetical protein
MFINPLLQAKNIQKNEDQEKEEWSDDDKYDPKLTKEQKKV